MPSSLYLLLFTIAVVIVVVFAARDDPATLLPSFVVVDCGASRASGAVEGVVTSGAAAIVVIFCLNAPLFRAIARCCAITTPYAFASVFSQDVHLHPAPHRTPAEKHTQYSFKHLLRLQVHAPTEFVSVGSIESTLF